MRRLLTMRICGPLLPVLTGCGRCGSDSVLPIVSGSVGLKAAGARLVVSAGFSVGLFAGTLAGVTPDGVVAAGSSVTEDGSGFGARGFPCRAAGSTAPDAIGFGWLTSRIG